ncbi:unnamed protein product [Psylliodes chrysocephalus]|uniref:Nbr1 FW domain-containing protein n=1 Tax=Psylliodes chrysocephalus TaxID=3402493 RepID=A0A9P0CYM8_9CUCU|nr:unnamed protein product [Psylliodes chrysocephala]
MDVDNAASESPVTGNGVIDIEQSFLQQFSCMGTTDRDELIQQLQKLLGTQLNYSTAAFFLDMNNWNLQAAVCSYFDYENPNPLPQMKLVADPFANENESVEPNVRFKKTWHVSNSGNETWPTNCYAQCSDGHNLGGDRVPLPCLNPGEGFQLSVELEGPSVPGIYQSKWRLCTSKGSYFGDPMWVIVTVVEEGTIALTNQLSHFNELGALPPTSNAYNPFSPHQIHIGNNQDVAPPDGQKDSSMF